MKYALTLLVVLNIVVCCRGQELRISKTRFVGGDTLTYVEPRHTITTRDGGYLFTGITNSKNGTGDIPSWRPSTADNVVVGKLDSNLNIRWIKLYGGSGYDIGMNAVQTRDGGYAVLAYTWSNDYDVTGFHGGGGDTWLIKLDSVGNLLWENCFGSSMQDAPISITETKDAGFIFSNISNGADGDVLVHYSGSQFDFDWFIVKTDSVGNKQWSKTIGGRGDEYESGTILCDTDGYLFISSSNSTDYDVHDTVWHPGITSGYDFYVFKLDLNGNIIWDSSYGSSNGDVVYDAKWDPRDSTIVMAGVTLANDYMVSGNHGGDDMWVIKIDRQGRLVWQRCLGGVATDDGVSITCTPWGYAVLGWTFPGQFGRYDGWLFALEDNGLELCNHLFGGDNYEQPYSVIANKAGILAIGASSSNFFTEGSNIGLLPGLRDKSFFTRFEFWPLVVDVPKAWNGENLSVCPNPSRDMVHIIFPLKTNGNLEVHNIFGQTVFDCITMEKEMDIITRSWQPGPYLVQWRGNGNVRNCRLIIE